MEPKAEECMRLGLIQKCEVLAVVTVTLTVLWDMTQCNPVDIYTSLSEEPAVSIFRVEEGRCFAAFLEEHASGQKSYSSVLMIMRDEQISPRNVGKCIPDCTTSFSRIQ
jgi:hypothetical protein